MKKTHFRGAERDVVRASVVSHYAAGATMLVVAEAHEMSAGLVRTLLEEAGVLKPGELAEQRSRKWFYNTELFCEHNSDVTAYYAGLLMADGSLRSDGKSIPRLTLSLHEQDRSAVEGFVDAIELDRSGIVIIPGFWQKDGYYRSTQARVDLFHSRWPEVLKSWGVVPRKSYHFSPPDVADAVLPAYLRGWFDGDGSVDKKGYRLWRVAGNRPSLDWYLEALQCLGYTGGHFFDEAAGVPQLCISGYRQVGRVRALLDGLPRFERKWEYPYEVPRFDTLNEAAELLGVSHRWLRRGLDEGILPYNRRGTWRYVDAWEIGNLIGITPDNAHRRESRAAVLAALEISAPRLDEMTRLGLIPSTLLRIGSYQVKRYDVDEARAALEAYRETLPALWKARGQAAARTRMSREASTASGGGIEE